VQDTEDFPTACRALLDEVLKSAQVLQDNVSVAKDNVVTALSIIDLGFGCGDQCEYFRDVLDSQTQSKGDHPRRSILKAYLGITVDNCQFSLAQERLGHRKQFNTKGLFEIYCADAGKPETWPLEIQNAATLACRANDGEDLEIWLLGLDTLYHFRPSRWPIIEYANRDLGASLMAYDVCIAENVSVGQRIILRLLAYFGQSPFANWVTVQEYRERLVLAGYPSENIDIRDISEHVFHPLAEFQKRREAELEQYGLSIGRFRYATSMFAWWARSGIVRGCIIIARK
jgi:hypothetical protein